VRRIVITVDVQDGLTDADVATQIGCLDGFADPTAWEWNNFWKDAEEGQLGPFGDSTAESFKRLHRPLQPVKRKAGSRAK